jgi:hypothetical protein
MLAAGLLLFEFGLSDFVEMQTGAWYRPWWLCLWKTATVIALLALFVLFRRRRSVSTPAVTSGAAAHRSRLIGWITLLWRGGCAALVASACVLLFVPVARIGPESCNRIHPGMTVAQAARIVGAPTARGGAATNPTGPEVAVNSFSILMKTAASSRPPSTRGSPCGGP